MEDRGVARADPVRAGPEEEGEGHRDQPDPHYNRQELLGRKGSDRIREPIGTGASLGTLWKRILGVDTEQEAQHYARIAGQEIRRERARARKKPAFGPCETGSEGGITRPKKRPRTLDFPHCFGPGEQEDRGGKEQSGTLTITVAGERFEDQKDQGSHPQPRGSSERDLHGEGDDPERDSGPERSEQERHADQQES